MRLLIFTLALVAAFSSHSNAQETAIEDVITAQINAFKADDVNTAFTFASPTIRNLFGTPEKFGAMVICSYPMVWRPSEFFYGQRTQQGPTTEQQLRIVDQSGEEFWFVYKMVKVGDQWRVNGVYRIDAPNLST
jgi:hypothetical protein